MDARLFGAVSAIAIAISSPAFAQIIQVTSAEAGGGEAAPSGAHRGQAEEINFSVPDGPLSLVLGQIVTQARATVSTTRDIGDTPVKGVRGRMTLAAALAQALGGTGWRADATAGGAIRLVRTGAADKTVLEEVVVTARRTDFARADTSLLTRSSTSLRQIPATVDSVTEEVIKSQNVMSVAEALRNIPGVLLLNGTGSSVMVGDGTTEGVSFTGGLRNSSLTGNAPITDVESVEVLKGVASILTGTQVAGGVVNYVPKRADGAGRREVSAGVGTGEEFLATFDFGAPLPLGDGWAVRLVGQVQTAQKRPNGSNDPHSHALNGMVGYRDETFKADVGVQLYTTKTAMVDLASYDPLTGVYADYGSRLNAGRHATVESGRLTYGVEKDLISGADLVLKARARGLVQRATSKLQTQAPIAYDFLGMGSYVVGSAGVVSQTQYSNYADLYAEFSTGPLGHKAILAADLSYQDQKSRASPVGLDFTTVPLPLIPIDRSAPPSTTEEEQYGLILQDQVTFGRLHALLGLRQSWYTNTNRPVGAPTATVQKLDKLLPSLGLVYDVSAALSVYASYREGFEPQSPDRFPTFDGSALGPALQKRSELGFKSGLFGDRLTLNGSYYWYSTEDQAVIDLDHAGGQFFYVNGPGAEGEGYEVSVAGSITPTFKILAGYTHQTKRRLDGNPVNGLPKDIANLWAIKTFNLGSERSLDVGFGANYNTGSTGFSIFKGPTPVAVDREFLAFRATVGYRFGDTRINLSVDNLFDRRNYEPVEVIDAIPIAPPRVIRLVVTKAF